MGLISKIRKMFTPEYRVASKRKQLQNWIKRGVIKGTMREPPNRTEALNEVIIIERPDPRTPVGIIGYWYYPLKGHVTKKLGDHTQKIITYSKMIEELKK